MKAQILYWLTAGVMLAAAGCSKTEPETPGGENEGEQITIMAGHPGAEIPGTRIAHEKDVTGISAYWTQGVEGCTDDAFKLYKGAAGQTFCIAENAGHKATLAVFTGTKPTGTGSYTAVYPAHRAESRLGSVTLSLLGQRQTGDGDLKHIGEYNYMIVEDIAEEDLRSVIFSPTVAVLGIKLSIPDADFAAKTVTISNTDNSEIAMGYKLSTRAYTTAKQLTMAVSDVSGSFTAYMVVFPTMLSQSLAVTVSGTDGEGVATTYKTQITVNNQREIVAGKVYSIPPAVAVANTAA
ncbi:hypothetical protein, partial [uncultured Alistipes sp.]|uniref:hypothetical protein n=1 Tax=uncultured Alistipes sp. TaxID=538949 RepID=UPI0027D99205